MPHGIKRIAVALMALGIIAATNPGGARAGDTLPYLTDQLKKPAYRSSLEAILRGQSKLPAWIGVFMKTMNGVADLGSPATIEGKPFEFYAVCQPHNCGGNFLYVLYAQGGGSAVGLVTKNGKVVAVLGNPSPAQRQVLMSQTEL
jgi:hypothetical protein